METAPSRQLTAMSSGDSAHDYHVNTSNASNHQINIPNIPIPPQRTDSSGNITSSFADAKATLRLTPPPPQTPTSPTSPISVVTATDLSFNVGNGNGNNGPQLSPSEELAAFQVMFPLHLNPFQDPVVDGDEGVIEYDGVDGQGDRGRVNNLSLKVLGSGGEMGGGANGNVVEGEGVSGGGSSPRTAVLARGV
ncbi:hypothetical protein HDU76_011256 [Blyttiomyces sp. JEL0837]|nr:hypothetical protein HDU76_011256 [Blyttiomyces sp. JEL0837]